MDNSNKNFLLQLLEYKIKPNLLHYTIDQLTHIYIELNNEKESLLNKIKNTFPSNTLKIIENIFSNSKTINLIKIEQDAIKKKILIDWIDDLWKKLPLLDNNNDIVDCVICLNHITNDDYITFKCNHITHTTCFLNYLFSNLKNKPNIDTKIEKLFRCPNCRNFLTDIVKKSFEQNELINSIEYNGYEFNNEINNNNDNNNNNNNNNNNDNVEQMYGDEYNNFILQQYNLVANTLDNYTLNNIFRTSNNIGFNYNIETISDNWISNVVVDHNERTITRSSSSNFSFSSDSDINSDTDSDEN